MNFLVKDSELEFQNFWKTSKTDRQALESKRRDLELRKQASGKPLVQSWFRQAQSKKAQLSTQANHDASECEIIHSVPLEGPVETGTGDQAENPIGIIPRKRRPEQERAEESINIINKRIADLVSARSAGLLTSEHRQELKRLKVELDGKRVKLKRLKTLRKAQLKHRNKQRKILKDLRQADPEKLEGLSVQAEPGRPRLEESQPGLLDAIVDIVKTFASADQKRRCESMRYVKTLDQLLIELQEMGKPMKY